MKEVCVITGGGSGMGLAAAREVGRQSAVVISGRNEQKLQAALQQLRDSGIDAHAVAGDVADRQSVEYLARAASEIGKITSVIHAAGISPNMGEAEHILRINALGTLHINAVFLDYLQPGGCMVNVASVGGYMVPSLLLPTRAYKLGQVSPERFLQKALGRTRFLPSKFRSGLAYGISKHFVIWLTRDQVNTYAAKGLRILSVSPGAFETDMGEIEKEGADSLLEGCAIKRYGKPEEIGRLLAYCIDRELGYLTGVDIPCDGGFMAGYKK